MPTVGVLGRGCSKGSGAKIVSHFRDIICSLHQAGALKSYLNFRGNILNIYAIMKIK